MKMEVAIREFLKDCGIQFRYKDADKLTFNYYKVLKDYDNRVILETLERAKKQTRFPILATIMTIANEQNQILQAELQADEKQKSWWEYQSVEDLFWAMRYYPLAFIANNDIECGSVEGVELLPKDIVKQMNNIGHWGFINKKEHNRNDINHLEIEFQKLRREHLVFDEA